MKGPIGGKIQILGGKVVCPASDTHGDFDLVVEDGKVSALAPRGSLPKEKGVSQINAVGKLVVPGLVDIHVHLREPGFEWKETIESGARSAIAGGVTTVCCMPNTSPVIDTAQVARFIHERAAAAVARVLPIGAVSVGQKGEDLAPLLELAEAGCVGFSDDGHPVWDCGVMRRALEWARITGKPLMVHEEERALTKGGSMHEGSRQARMGLRGLPSAAEDIMVARDIELVRLTGGRLHILHVSSARSVELIRRAKAEELPITAEVAPHNLVLTDQECEGYNTNAKMYPPLRSQADCDAMLEGLRDGTIDLVATDHAPHDLDSKRVEFERAAMGILGLPTLLPVMLGLVERGSLTLERAIQSVTEAPCRILGLPHGTLAVGAAADITIIDPERRWVLDNATNFSLSRNSPWWGKELKGAAAEVFVGGRHVYSQGSFL